MRKEKTNRHTEDKRRIERMRRAAAGCSEGERAKH